MMLPPVPTTRAFPPPAHGHLDNSSEGWEEPARRIGPADRERRPAAEAEGGRRREGLRDREQAAHSIRGKDSSTDGWRIPDLVPPRGSYARPVPGLGLRDDAPGGPGPGPAPLRRRVRADGRRLAAGDPAHPAAEARSGQGPGRP